jgi:hypothetical protein
LRVLIGGVLPPGNAKGLHDVETDRFLRGSSSEHVTCFRRRPRCTESAARRSV